MRLEELPALTGQGRGLRRQRGEVRMWFKKEARGLALVIWPVRGLCGVGPAVG